MSGRADGGREDSISQNTGKKQETRERLRREAAHLKRTELPILSPHSATRGCLHYLSTEESPVGSALGHEDNALWKGGTVTSTCTLSGI